MSQEKKEITFDCFGSGLVERKFTPEWSKSGLFNIDKVSELVGSIVTQRNEMVKYIEALHDKIDEIIEKNSLCPFCLTAGCTSDHK